MTATAKRIAPIAILSLAVLAACASKTVYESYRPVQNRSVDIAYVNVAADFTKYRRLLPEEMGIFYPTNAAPSDADLDRVRSAFRQAFMARIEGYELVDEAAEDVLQVKATLVDLRNAGALDIPDIARDINAILEPGKLTFMIEMRDSNTDRLMLRAADTEKSPQIDLPEDGSANTDEVMAAAEHWAQLFRNFLDTNLRGGR